MLPQAYMRLVDSRFKAQKVFPPKASIQGEHMALLQHDHSSCDSAMVALQAQREFDGAATLKMMCPLPPPHLGDLLRATQPYVSALSAAETTRLPPSVSRSGVEPSEKPDSAGSTSRVLDQDFDAGSLPYQLSVTIARHRPEVSSEQQTHLANQSYLRSRNTKPGIPGDAHNNAILSSERPYGGSRSLSFKAIPVHESRKAAVSPLSLPQHITRSPALSDEEPLTLAFDPSAHANFQLPSRQRPYSGVLTSSGPVDLITSTNTESLRLFQNADVDNPPTIRADLSEPMRADHSLHVDDTIIKPYPHRLMESPLNASDPPRPRISTQHRPSTCPETQHTSAPLDLGSRLADSRGAHVVDNGIISSSHSEPGLNRAAPSKPRRKGLLGIFRRRGSLSASSNGLQGSVADGTNYLHDPSKRGFGRQSSREHLGSGVLGGSDNVAKPPHHSRFLSLKKFFRTASTRTLHSSGSRLPSSPMTKEKAPGSSGRDLHGMSGQHLIIEAKSARTLQNSNRTAFTYPDSDLGNECRNQSAQAPTIVQERPVRRDLVTGQLKGYHQHNSSDQMQRPIRPRSDNSRSSNSAKLTGYDTNGSVLHDQSSQHAFQPAASLPHPTAQLDVGNSSTQGVTQLHTVHGTHSRSGSLPPLEAHLASAGVLNAGESRYRHNRPVNGLGVPLRSPNRPMSYPNRSGANLTKPVPLTQLIIPSEPRRGYSGTDHFKQPLTTLQEALNLKPLPPPPPPSKSPLETHPLLERSLSSSMGNKKSVHYAALT
ncbi:MAG: hypothetical protein M1816_002471 [Peltula sp. TS41687]|nr:MAG: hypothetical protein M1816_002471 [Peltula sp. TS41687]